MCTRAERQATAAGVQQQHTLFMTSRERLSNKNSSFCRSMGTGFTSSQIVFLRFSRLKSDFSSFTSFQNNFTVFTVFLFLARVRVALSSELFEAVDARDGVGDELLADREELTLSLSARVTRSPGGGGGGGGPKPRVGGGGGGGAGIGDPPAVVALSNDDTDSTSVSSSGFRSEKSRSLMCRGRRWTGDRLPAGTSTACAGLRISRRVTGFTS